MASLSAGPETQNHRKWVTKRRTQNKSNLQRWFFSAVTGAAKLFYLQCPAVSSKCGMFITNSNWSIILNLKINWVHQRWLRRGLLKRWFRGNCLRGRGPGGGSFYLIVGRGARQVRPSTLLCYISLLLCYISLLLCYVLMLSNWISQLGSWETNKVQPSSIWAFYNAALIFQ